MAVSSACAARADGTATRLHVHRRQDAREVGPERQQVEQVAPPQGEAGGHERERVEIERRPETDSKAMPTEWASGHPGIEQPKRKKRPAR